MCNRSDQEVQQILLSQLSDDEVEIVFLHLENFNEAYNEITEANESYFTSNNSNHQINNNSLVNVEKGDNLSRLGNNKSTDEHYRGHQQDLFDTFADMNKPGYQKTVSPLMADNSNNRAGGRNPQYSSEASKGSIRRKISLSSIAHMWSAK